MRLLGHTLFAATTIAISLMVAPACVDNDQSIFIRNVVAPPTGGGDCTYTADATGVGLFEGRLDVALTQTYQAVVLVGNQMKQRSEDINARAESNAAHLDGAIVRVTTSNNEEINSFTSPASGFANAATGITPSFGLMKITLLDPDTVAKVLAKVDVCKGDALILANIKAFGETNGGVDLESGEFQFGIRVCDARCGGCLVDYSQFDDPAVDGPDCNKSATTTTTTTQIESTCSPIGQDAPVSCALCSSAFAVCRKR